MPWWKHASLFLALLAGFLLTVQAAYCQELTPLSTGDWYRIGVTKSGIYKLDAPFLRKLGIEPGGIDPKTIRILGGPAGMLPQSNAAGISMLNEVAVQVTGEADNRFDAGDAAFFYAEGPHIVTYDTASASLSHQLHVYSDTAFYFLNIGAQNGLRIVPANYPAKPSARLVSHFDDYWYHEQETTNLLKSGREWWGEYLGSGTITVAATIPGVIPQSEIRVNTSAVGAAQVTTKFKWSLNGTVLGEVPIGTVSASTYDIKGIRADKTFTTSAGAVPATEYNAGITYEKNGQSSAQGYLNYISLQTKRNFSSYDTQQLYHLLPSSDTVTYRFTNTSAGWNLWDVTDMVHPAMIVDAMPAGTFDFTYPGAPASRKVAGFSSTLAFEPASWEKITNQNLTFIDVPKLLIVTPPQWQNEAARLATYRKDHDGIAATVVTTRQIYNEFAGGKPDVTAIRNFVRYLYEKSPGKLRYLLLFGDATYDYKNNLLNQPVQQRGNWVPVYESRESLNPVYTYSSDDYFGFLEKSEGTWTEALTGDHTLDIGIGRLPAKNAAEAKTIVDKLIRYDRLAPGLWKSKVQFVADDGDGNIHQQHADQLANLIQRDFLPSRTFIDAFEQNTTEQGPKAPQVNAEILKHIDQGTLILNYIGHGGVSGWAEEQILTLADMQAARGISNLPLLLTATCDFGRYDDPAIVSGAEIMVLSPKGAAIGAISTTRPVYSSTNYTLSRAFYETLVSDGPGVRMGDIFRDTKNKALAGSLNRNFTLLGDPSMRLARPESGIRWTTKPDTLRALQTVLLAGEVLLPGSNTKDSLFNGTARMVVYDKESPFRTLGNEGASGEYRQFTSKLFDGTASVRGGQFSMRFTVPRDIDYRTGTGRVDVYAFAGDTLAEAGSQLDIVVGGSAQVGDDTTPPTVTAYLDEEAFRDGDRTGPSPILYIKARDSSGINISSAGIGHDITVTLNDTLTIVLNDYFTASLDDPGSGLVVYPFQNLPAGLYNARVKVWDVYTNLSEIAFAFQVGAAAGIKLNNLNVFPNPFDKDLSFEISHSRSGEDVEIIFNILLNNGQKLGVFRQQYYNSSETVREVMIIPPGSLPPRNSLLLFQAEVRSLKDNSSDRKSGKLIRSP
ncbi:type IX secretion system sortase PorU [Dyadobacter sandarakinus]|uniref:Type IX secretion system sortase PorU n=1 Tax=Dyadobacter sandarakinus TaxID=2747268 RepID=A0ABX7I930_9BACT|nr:type IX secretion system sortase PorU [Dyadobacter sandarakinus]QRR02400.1 type IX secretion system sortase PorU [Dyadobacter sandarakinus]